MKIIKRLASVAPEPNTDFKVMGVDPSTYTGLVVLHKNDVQYCGTLRFPNLKGYARLHSIAEQLLVRVEEYAPDFIFIERPITSGAFNNQIQTQIAVAIRMALFQTNRKWWDVSPTTLKKWVTGSGKADKKQMAAAVLARWGFASKSDDEIDGFALAKLGQFVLATDALTNTKGVQDGDP